MNDDYGYFANRPGTPGRPDLHTSQGGLGRLGAEQPAPWTSENASRSSGIPLAPLAAGAGGLVVAVSAGGAVSCWLSS